MDHKLTLKVPVSEQQANQLSRTLSVDKDLKPTEFFKKVSVQNGQLQADFSAVSVRSLRVGVNSFMDNLNECLETLSHFGN